MARLLAAAVAGRPEAAISLRPEGDFTMVASALLRSLRHWAAVAGADGRYGCIDSDEGREDRPFDASLVGVPPELEAYALLP
jgi:hypothetical protein